MPLLGAGAGALASSTSDETKSFFSGILRKVRGALSLLPIFDTITDLAAFIQFQYHGQHGWALVLFSILVANWRFTTVFAALTPRPSLRAVFVLYIPFLLLPMWTSLLMNEGDEKNATPASEKATTGDLDDASSTAADPASVDLAKSPDKLKLSAEVQKHVDDRLAEARAEAATLREEVATLSSENANLRGENKTVSEHLVDSLYGQEPLWVRKTLLSQHKAIEGLWQQLGHVATCPSSCAELRTWARLLWEMLLSEGMIFALSPLLGPYLTWGAGLTLAREAAFTEADDMGVDTAEKAKHVLYNRVLTLIEGLCESMPQLILQTSVYFMISGSMSTSVFIFSATCVHCGIAWFVMLCDEAYMLLCGRCSLCGITKALVEFIIYREQILQVLGPPKSVQLAAARAAFEAATDLEGDGCDVNMARTLVAAVRALGENEEADTMEKAMHIAFPETAETDIFISFRYIEARNQAIKIEAGLKKKGFRVFRSGELGESSDREVRDNLGKTIIKAIDQAKMVIFMGSRTYGTKTNYISTYEEMNFAQVGVSKGTKVRSPQHVLRALAYP